MQRKFMNMWDEMDALMERLMGETFADFPTRNFGFQIAFNRIPMAESGCHKSCSGNCSGVSDTMIEPVAEVHRTPGTLTVVTELPGASEQGITLDLKGTTLVIDADAGDVHYRANADISDAPVGPMQSSFRNGVLEVTFRDAATG